ncbi:MAG: glycosyltransferase [Gammaproteobacteria bacterium]|nr:glycosyltransferase [Gammaproteobacteria bacterium]MCP5424778.1 glycosyltransferase [Gammaproteobacteria bacterium]MCP5458245.1 glycosyltransferase [Gammaproteobacteria bacterium]
MSQPKRLAVLVASLAIGGIGKMRVHLINEFAQRGLAVDLLAARTDSPYMASLSPAVRVIDIRTSHSLYAVPRLAWYLRRQRPDALLAERIRVNVAALRSRWMARTGTPIFATLNTQLSHQLDSLKPAKKQKHLRLMRRYYPLNDGLIAISQGVADDASALLDYPRERIAIIANPVVTARLHEQARAPLDHPWLQPGQPPLVLGVGRLEPQKDFPTLLRAFALFRQRRDSRLLILGDGKLGPALKSLATELGIQDAVDMPGFVDNPYAYMARASLFVSSSAWEGSGNALTEALAVGTPVVSTDCPSGPREILQDGRYGPLVPVGDAPALAQAMLETLERAPSADWLRGAAARFTVEASAEHYLARMGLA